MIHDRKFKKLKSSPISPILIGDITFSHENVTYIPIQILVDSGASSSIILKKFCNKFSITLDKETKWETKGGTFKTHQKSKVQFRLPELDKNKIILWNTHVDEQHSEDS